MRRLVFAFVVLAAIRGEAKPEVVATPMTPPVDPDRGNFWREITEPHKEERTCGNNNNIREHLKRIKRSQDSLMCQEYQKTVALK